ncbi:methyltransferase [Granulosicoccus sp. 3-233]|uniref:methyltransferase n=1 Tax=Granulosicoccus sp. 3-233 TaxID=3417969 RepID=UPI003D34DE4A
MTASDGFCMKNAMGDWQLQRWPITTDASLQAWDAADSLLLTHVSELLAQRPAGYANVLLLNDAHGALATSLHSLSPVSWSDSCLAHRAAEENLRRNGIASPLRKLASTQTPDGPIDLVLIRVPKTNALLEDQLARLRPCLDADTVVVAAAMVKHLQKSAFVCMEQYLGKVTTSLAVKKARLLFVDIDRNLPERRSPYPSEFTDTETGMTLLNHANVFSRSHLDHGARFLLSHYADLPKSVQVVDLGCGNGVLGIALQQIMPDARVQFIDESYSAVASARDNHERYFAGRAVQADFQVADGLEKRASGSVDLVLCNPPFHQQHVLGDQLARSMFEGSKRCLRQGGELRVVANRHLGYSRTLRQLFGNCRVVASNDKFAILKSLKR